MSKRTRYGFTLVELLVVVSIIALLLAILLPAINKARDAARAVVCGSNLKQVSIASQMYGSDWDTYLPPSGINRFYVRGSNPSQTQHAAWTDPPFLGQYLNNDRPIIFDKNTTGFIPTDKASALQCPSDKSETSAGGSRRRASYGMNGNLSTVYQYPGGGLYTWVVYKPSGIDEPSRTVIYLDAARRWFPGWGDTGPCLGLPDAANPSDNNWRMRHGNTGEACNVAFVDGHTETAIDLTRAFETDDVRIYQYDGNIINDPAIGHPVVAITMVETDD